MKSVVIFLFFTVFALASEPPQVVKTVPQSGDTQVDPDLTEISVTFDKDMQTNDMWSWCMESRETFPKVDVGRIRFLEDQRTCVLPVKLEPGKTYVIWINTEQHDSFRDVDGQAAVPFRLFFRTKMEGSE